MSIVSGQQEWFRGGAAANVHSAGHQAFSPEFDRGVGIGGGGAASFENEPPLLEELGIDFNEIYKKTFSVLHPTQEIDRTLFAEGSGDLAGPLIFCLLLGGALLLKGKIHFGYIYGVAVVGCLGLWMVLNLMSQKGIEVSQTCSILGYCLLPMALLALLSIGLSGILIYIVGVVFIAWCATRAASMFIAALSTEVDNMKNQRWLVAYPVALFYGCFALLAVF